MDQGDPPAPKAHKSWVTEAKQNKVLKKYDLDISSSEGNQSVDVPSAIVDEANLLWDDFVITRFMETAPHVAKVHDILNKIWAFGDKLQKKVVYEMDEVTMKIRVPNEAIREKVIRRGIWNIAGVPIVVSKWSLVKDDSKARLTPLWVHLKQVPMNMYSWEGLSFIASAAGIPDKLHPETIGCTNLEIAKICVTADLSKQLLRKINFKIQGVQTLVEFTYSWLPSKCSACGKWGHSEKVCSVNKINKDEEKETQPSEIEVHEEELETIELGEQSKKREELIVDAKEKEDVTNEPWKKVSAEKVGKSPLKPVLQFGQVKIITPSRFAALRILE